MGNSENLVVKLYEELLDDNVWLENTRHDGLWQLIESVVLEYSSETTSVIRSKLKNALYDFRIDQRILKFKG